MNYLSIYLIIDVVLFVVLVVMFTVVIPKFCIIKRPTNIEFDGKRYLENDDGYAIVFGNNDNNKYITEYILSNVSKRNVFTCSYGPDVNKISYSVYVYNKKGNLIKKISVYEEIKSTNISLEIPLPKKASFVSVNVNAVNEQIITEEDNSKDQVKLEKGYLPVSIISICVLFPAIYFMTIFAVNDHYPDIICGNFLMILFLLIITGITVWINISYYKKHNK